MINNLKFKITHPSFGGKNLKFIEILFGNQLLAGSAIMVLGSNLFNALQFIYHFITARVFEKVHGELLGKVYYGDFAAMLSSLGIISIIQVSLGLAVIKFIAAQAKKDSYNFARWVNYWSIWMGVFITIIAFILTPSITIFLNLSQPNSFYIFSLMLFVFIVLTSQRSILQGILRFDLYVLTLFAEGIFKILFTILFIFSGMAVFGAVVGFSLGIIFSLVVSRVSLSKILGGPKGKMPTVTPLIRYCFPVLAQGLALTSMFSSDLLLVKHFFSPEEAGIYASLAVLGRVVLFSSTPVIHTMFPLVARRFSRGEPVQSLFYLSIMIVLGIGGAVVLLYLFFPQLPILALYGDSYLKGSPLLWLYAIFMLFLSISMLITQFYLSINRSLPVLFFAAAAISQIMLIWFIHPSIDAVIKLSILCAALLCMCLFVYFAYLKIKHEKTSFSDRASIQTRQNNQKRSGKHR